MYKIYSVVCFHMKAPYENRLFWNNLGYDIRYPENPLYQNVPSGLLCCFIFLICALGLPQNKFHQYALS